jgi:broad specificity phosphatase PhoE
MQVYFVRHGQSLANKQAKSHTPEIPLSKTGINQAKAIAKRLKNVPFDIIYASHYKRASQTAQIIERELGVPIEYWEKLRERKRPSEGEGKSLDDPVVVKIDKVIEKNRHNKSYKYSDDESLDDLMKRAKSVTSHLIKNHKNQNVLCVSHAGLIKVVVSYILFGENLPAKNFWDFYYHSWHENTGITHIEYTKKYGWGLLTWNDTTHL